MSKVVQNQKAKTKEKKLLTCSMCQKQKVEMDFYTSNDLSLHATGKYPYCKSCLQNKCLDVTGKFSVELFKDMLKILDRPFITDILERTMANHPNSIVGTYLKTIGMPSHRYKTWNNSTLDFFNESGTSDGEVSEDIKQFFGAGYEDFEYKAMYKKYNFLKNNYDETTNMHTESLLTYVRLKVKEEFATASGDSGNAKVWAELANKAATNAKINPSQLSKADLMGGLNTFSELSQAIEEAVDIVPILPKFKARPNDALDFNIWCYINYARELQGLPLCSYEDVYAFYDKRKADYIKQYGDPLGIFQEDNSENNRSNIRKFITPFAEDVEDDDIAEEGVEDSDL